jgi:cellulose synthase/poly-beta-1,6-N-acetylglucosamine synthase-like glycosyltransferase
MRWLFWAACGAIVYTFLGYPLLVAALARVAPRRWRRSSETPSVSLVIAAYNEASWIEHKLENTYQLDYPHDRLQIIVAADGSDDGTDRIVRRTSDERVELLYEPTRLGKAAALNRAVERARGEIVVFSDANAIYEPDALQHLVASFADPAVAVVTGAKSVIGGHTAFGRAEALYWRYEAWIRRNESLVGSATGLNGEILAVRRDDWHPLAQDTINDDFAIGLGAMSRGRRVIFEPGARASESSTARARDELVRRERMIAGRWQAITALGQLMAPLRPVLLWQVASHKAMRALLPVFLVLASIANAGAVAQRRVGSWSDCVDRLIFVGQILTAALTGCRLLGLPMPRPLDQIAGIATYVVLSQVASLRGLITWMRGRHSPLWSKVGRRMDPAVDQPWHGQGR